MQTLVQNLGLDWKALLWYAFNFILLLVVLKLLAYKPLLKLLAERRKKIEQGLEKAEEASRRLAEIGELEKERLKEADKKGLLVITEAEKRAREQEQKIMAEAAVKESDMMERAKEKARQMAIEMEHKMENEASAMVRKILIERVRLKPEAVDEALIEKVAQTVRELA
jgi:F-type H+-transporting ATPase subunit b